MFPLGTAILCSSLAAFLATLVFTAAARALALRLGIVDRPAERKIHQRAIPYMGGVGIFAGFLTGIFIFAWMAPDLAWMAGGAFKAVLTGGAAVCILGLWDDVRGLKALPKLTFEILLATFMWTRGLRVERVTLPWGGTLDLGEVFSRANSADLIRIGGGMGGLLQDGRIALAIAISLLITIGWYVLLMNAINLIDGLDGLAASITTVSALVIVIVAILVNDRPPIDVVVIGALTAAACLGFLRYNWHPASIFMGDAGALLLGFLLASASLLSSTKAQTLLTLLVPLLAVGLPVVESVHSFVRRVGSGAHPFRADRRHLHHRLLDLGLSHPRVVSILLYLTVLLGLMAFLLATANAPLATIFSVLLLGAGFLILLENLAFLERKQNGASRPPSATSSPKDSGG